MINFSSEMNASYGAHMKLIKGYPNSNTEFQEFYFNLAPISLTIWEEILICYGH